MKEMAKQVSIFDLDSSFGKTFPEHSAPTKDKTLESSSKKSQKLSTKMPLFLCLQKTNGQQVDASWEMGGALLGEYSMHSFVESPKEDVESHLSQILEVDVPRKYYLSAKACEGILRRAKRRNKVLPKMLKDALEYMVPVIVEGLDCYNQQMTGGKTMTLTNCATDTHHIPCVVMDRSAFNQGTNVKYSIGIDENGIAFSHIAKGPGAVCYIDTSHADDVVRTDDVVAPPVCYKKPHYIVRRLTPLECERLQGFPDGWTDIGEYTDSKGKKKKTSDSARYKALGNSIALPPWKWVVKRLCSHYERDVTLASLFDGIGGFPILWEQINGKGSCLWASEIEDFPIAVTKARIE